MKSPRKRREAGGPDFTILGPPLATGRGPVPGQHRLRGQKRTDVPGGRRPLCPTGAAYVAQRLAWRLERYLQLTPKDDGLAVAIRMELKSQARDKETAYLAFVPQATMRAALSPAGAGPADKLPVLYLLHGSGGILDRFFGAGTRDAAAAGHQVGFDSGHAGRAIGGLVPGQRVGKDRHLSRA